MAPWVALDGFGVADEGRGVEFTDKVPEQAGQSQSAGSCSFRETWETWERSIRRCAPRQKQVTREACQNQRTRQGKLPFYYT